VSPDSATMPIIEAAEDGAAILLTLIRADSSRLSVPLGVPEAVAIAADLIQAARLRMGRAEWPPKIPEAT
jgi:hypothetical protein